MSEGIQSDDYLISVLKERAKELNCLYQVEELLNNNLLSLPEIFNGIIKVIPSGWQFPEYCQSRIIYENHNYQSENYCISSITDGCNIKVDDKVVGNIEVSYSNEIPLHEEGYFLEKEHKLICTIADRIGQTILQRQMERILHEWKLAQNELSMKDDKNNEWIIIVNLLKRIDQGMLSHICRKLINYLFLINVPEASEILKVSGEGKNNSLEVDFTNSPSIKQPLENTNKICDKTFKIASKYMSDSEITLRLKKWIREEKFYNLISAVNKNNSSVTEIIQAVNRNKYTAEDLDLLYSPMERSLKVSLIRRFLSDKPEYINVAKQYIELSDFSELLNRVIYPQGSHGKIGGKSAGLFLAHQIIKKECRNLPILSTVEVPKTWYITTDEINDFLFYNDLQELNEQKYKSLQELRIDYPHVIQLMKNARFPAEIIKSLSMVLDDLGEKPIVVRSSSNLEDQIGAAFSGKYKSLFLANQGSKEKRLDALMDAIIEVYASLFNPDCIQYRHEKGLLDFNEEMGIMIQEVVGSRIGDFFLPDFAGVAFSFNDFQWSPEIKREDGLIRLVPGLGTRAVDRISDDFPVLISPEHPELKVNSAFDEMKKYSPKKTDVININKNTFETIELSKLFKECSIGKFDENKILRLYRGASESNISFEECIVTFDGLISDTKFIKQIKNVLVLLHEKIGIPIDIEFASNGDLLYILQCRPQSFSEDILPSPIPKDIDKKDIVFSAKRFITGGRIPDISYIVYIDPEGYNRLYGSDSRLKVGRAVGQLNHILPKRQFVLMGPGRWGCRGDITMGVPVGYSDINNSAALVEIARRKLNHIPELSFGTHFFQDLIESNIRYIPLYPDDDGIVFNTGFLTRSNSLLEKLLPEYTDLNDVIRVIDINAVTYGKILKIALNAELGEALGFITTPSTETIKSDNQIRINKWKTGDDFWHWRHYMAEQLASRLDSNRFGVEAIYLFGSTNNASAGPGSDIDILIHFNGTDAKRIELANWLEGWSLCLSEMNYLKTGYSSEGLLDIHIVGDEEIKKKAPFANKIGAITDPAFPLKMKK